MGVAVAVSDESASKYFSQDSESRFAYCTFEAERPADVLIRTSLEKLTLELDGFLKASCRPLTDEPGEKAELSEE